MPYIITAHPRLTKPMPGATSRRAVATLEEARAAVYAEMAERPRYALMDAATLNRQIEESLTDGMSRAKIGPLPDGTVIEVARVRYADLAPRGVGISRQSAQQMWEAHEEGMHDGLPREGCPACEGRTLLDYLPADQLAKQIIDTYNARQT